MPERLAYVLVLVLFTACDSRGGAPPIGLPAPPSAQPTPPATATAIPPGRTGPWPTTPTPPPPTPGSGQAATQLAQALDVLNRTMHAMHEAATTAGGANDCEHGYLSRVAADAARLRTLAESPITAAAPRPLWLIAPHDRFVALCQTLPEAVQRCSGFARYQDDQPGCDGALATLTPAQHDAWSELFHEQSPSPPSR